MKTRVYEAGYQISPIVEETGVEKVVGEIRSEIEKNGGSLISEGAPSLNRLAYPIDGKENGKRITYDKAYFGWLKFEVETSKAEAITKFLETNPLILRALVFKTLREETRAKIKAPQLKEVRRGEMLKPAPRKEESAKPATEAEMAKAVDEVLEA